MPSGDVTILLQAWRAGSQEAGEQLTPIVYERLHRMADIFLQRETSGHAWQPTELVNELFVELLKLDRLTWKDRNHFFSFSARVMRQILIGHARRVKAAKRNNGSIDYLPLNAELNWIGAGENPETLDLAEALEELEQADPQRVHALELRYFFGFGSEETAQILGLSKATVDRNVRFALAWLHKRLHGGGGGGGSG